jgi:hypothetical protein
MGSSRARNACAKAFTQGLIDGFTIGLEGDWQALKDLPSLVWNGIKLAPRVTWKAIDLAPKTGYFAYRFATDEEFRAGVIAKAAEILKTLDQLQRQLPDAWAQFSASAARSLTAHIQRVSGLTPTDPDFQIWLGLYPGGWVGGIVTEAIAVGWATGEAGKAIAAIPKVQELMRALQLVAQTAARFSLEAIGKVFRKWGYEGLELLEQLAKDGRGLGVVDELLAAGLMPQELSQLREAGLKLEALGEKTPDRLVESFLAVAKAWAEDLHDLPRFADEVPQLLEKYGLTAEEFNRLRVMPLDQIESDEMIRKLVAIRREIPQPDANTLMIRVLQPGDEAKYLDGTYTGARGFMSRAQDVQDLRTSDQFLNVFELLFPGSAHQAGEPIHVLVFTTSTPDLVRIPYGGTSKEGAKRISGLLGAATEDVPWYEKKFTGNGLTISKNEIIPEFQATKELEFLQAVLFEVTPTGEWVPAGVYDASQEILIRL